eukprot:SAG31_NODE_4833_length_2919_cov_2.040426_3_plen_119_part_01
MRMSAKPISWHSAWQNHYPHRPGSCIDGGIAAVAVEKTLVANPTRNANIVVDLRCLHCVYVKPGSPAASGKSANRCEHAVDHRNCASVRNGERAARRRGEARPCRPSEPFQALDPNAAA